MCMMPMTQNMDGSMIAMMALFMGSGFAIGLVALVGTFYLIWRFIRAFERKET
ncbi:MAG: hypothetical protein ACQEWV_27935 [Bacillota bacterium]